MKIKGPHSMAEQTNVLRDKKLVPQSKLALIADKARKNPKEQFTSILHHLTPKLVEESLEEMNRKTSVGVDGMTVTQVTKHLDWLMPSVMNSIHKGTYQPPAVRRVYIPKATGGQRPLGIPSVLDRAIQASAVKILEQIYEQDFQKSSFGFRPKLSCHHAIATAGAWIKAFRLHHILEVDIRDFFGSISHGWLMKFLRHRIKDERMLKLIEGWLKAGVLEDGQWRITEMGTPQGGSISPLLANIYLHYVLDLWWEKKIKKRLKYRAEMVRYADDFMILFRTEYEAKEVLNLLKARLAQFGLAINEEKTHLTDVTPRVRKGNERRAINFLGFSVFYAQNLARNGWKLIYQTDRRRMNRAVSNIRAKMRLWMHESVEQQIQRINRVLRGHFNYYGMAGNIRRLVKFRHVVVRHWRECLSKRSQNGHQTWSDVNELLKRYPLQRAQIRLSYPVLATYSIL